MTNENYDCFLVKQQDGKLLKFSYDSEQGIYYQILMKREWSENISVYKDSFKYFYVLEDWNGEVHVFCQNICGNLILCTLGNKGWKYNTLLYMKHDIITPVQIKAFFYLKDIHLLYSIIDKYTYSEVLMHQVYNRKVTWTNPQIISNLEYYVRFPYSICKDSTLNIVIVNTMLGGGYQLASRSFHINEGRWGKEEIIHTSLLPYIDFAFCVERNRNHYLFIEQDDQVNRVIYHYKEIGVNKNIILFEHVDINSCLLMLYNEILWALWICDNKLYGCFSKDYGQNFSNYKIYKLFDNILPKKVVYQEYLENNNNNFFINEIYVMNLNGDIQLFLHEILDTSEESKLQKNKSLFKKNERLNLKKKNSKIHFEKIEIIKKEKVELQLKLNKAYEELKALSEDIKHEKSQVSNLKYKFYSEKEKLKSYINDNDMLRRRNSFLEQKILLSDNEKILTEKKLAEKEKENEKLKQQMTHECIENLSDSEEDKIKDKNNIPKHVRFSLIKWLFDDEL